MKQAKFTLTILFTTVAVALSSPAMGEKGGGKKGDNPSGNPDPILLIEADTPFIPPTLSNSVDNQGQAVFYGAMDLSPAFSPFSGTTDDGQACELEYEDGIVVVYPQTKGNPYEAELIFWYSDELQSGDTVTHLLTMQGRFDEPGNWPPGTDDPDTSITLDYWEFGAENRKAQRIDCAGSGWAKPGEGYVVHFTRMEP